MCEQRERLLGYVYDEGDAAERAEVQKHLDQCPDCRKEVAGLRSVRNDLLAWEVPPHQPVWRPFVAAPTVSWWRQVPAWAMAAAAGVMLLLGATGSVVAHTFMPDQLIARGATGAAPTATPAVTMADLTAAEKRVLAELSQQVGEVGARVQRVSNQSGSVETIEGDHNKLVERLLQLQSNDAAQLKIIDSLRAELANLKATTASDQKNTDTRIGNLSYLLAQGK